MHVSVPHFFLSLNEQMPEIDKSFLQVELKLQELSQGLGSNLAKYWLQK